MASLNSCGIVDVVRLVWMEESICRCFCLPARVCTSGVLLGCCWGDVCLIFGIREEEEEEEEEECSYAVLCCAGWIYVPRVG